MKIQIEDAGIEYFKFQISRYRFLMLGCIAALVFIFQNSIFGAEIDEARPNFLFSIAILFIGVFSSFTGYAGLSNVVSSLLRRKAIGEQGNLDFSKSRKWDIRIYWIAHQSFIFGVIGLFLEFTHFGLLKSTNWYQNYQGIFGWGGS